MRSDELVRGESSRRGVLAGLASAGVWVLAGCKSSMRTGLRASGPGWDELADAIEGEVYVRDERGYEDRRRAVQWNGRKAPRQPDAIARVASVADVQEAVRFARAAGVRVAVRGGGHSWCASSVRDGGLLLDLDAMRSIDIDPLERTALCDPAVRGRDLLATALPSGLAFPVGHCPTVPLSGFLLGGGLGWNAGTWGPSCLSVQAVDVVDARGELLYADAETNADLFWAARGAGPGFPAVAVRFHLKLHPLPRAIRTSTIELWSGALERVAAWLPELRASMPGGVELTCSMLSKRLSGSIVVSATAFAETDEEASSWLTPLEAGAELDGARASFVQRNTFDDLLESMREHFPEGRRYGADALWSKSPTDEVFGELAKTIEAAPSRDSLILCVPTPAPRADAPPLPDMACSLFAPLFVGVYGCWREAYDDEANMEWLRRAQQRLEHVTIGHYVGESDFTAEPHRARRSFTGAGWERLAEIRRERDPDGLFFSFLEVVART